MCDTRTGPLVAPVRFSVVLDSTLAWQSEWVDVPCTQQPLAVRVAGSGVVRLVVESEFSGGAHCVWVDPVLLVGGSVCSASTFGNHVIVM